MTAPGPDPTRRGQIGAGLAAVRGRIERACSAAGRDPGEITLVVVTKFFPASDVRLLAELGVTDLGENRDQEARAKFADVRADTPGLTLHFIGQLQSNKAHSVARYADVVHTVDRTRLVRALDQGAGAAGRRLAVLVQVDLDPRPRTPGQLVRPDRPELARGGISASAALDLAVQVAATEHLELRGVMGVAPLGADPAEAFARLAEVAGGIRERFPSACWVSAGMSGDLEAAVAHGATHLRVGTAILGTRPALR
jgi:pyridoxal phosphate enzyme (YggS family)